MLTTTPLPQANAYAMIGRRAAAAGIATKIGNHTFRATGITAYLKNGGTLENAAAMANHASTRTTQLYDRRSDQVSLDEIERGADLDPPSLSAGSAIKGRHKRLSTYHAGSKNPAPQRGSGALTVMRLALARP